MSNFNEEYGEGKLQEFITLLEEHDLETSVSIDADNQLLLTWIDKGSMLIKYNESVWDIQSMRSDINGLYDTLVQLTPFAKSLGIKSFRCDVTDKLFSDKLTTMGFRKESETKLFAPIDHIEEYAEWCSQGKPSESEPIWRKSL